MKRETAKRLLSMEFNSSTIYLGEGEKIPSYLLTPLGCLVNRAYVCGVLTEVEELESGYRARVSDPSGIFSIYSGQFQPEVSRFLSEVQTPSYVALLGKSRVYEPEKGVLYTSIRPERMKLAQKWERDLWIVRCCELTIGRIGAIRYCTGLERDEDRVNSRLSEMGYTKQIAKGAAMAYCRYDEIDLDRFIEGVRDALTYILGEEEISLTSSEDGLEEEVLKIIEELEGVGEGRGEGALWEDVLQRALGMGIEGGTAEKAIDQLLESGRIYEPALGVFKRS
jgi:hypothetical protein